MPNVIGGTGPFENASGQFVYNPYMGGQGSSSLSWDQYQQGLDLNPGQFGYSNGSGLIYSGGQWVQAPTDPNAKKVTATPTTGGTNPTSGGAGIPVPNPALIYNPTTGGAAPTTPTAGNGGQTLLRDYQPEGSGASGGGSSGPYSGAHPENPGMTWSSSANGGAGGYVQSPGQPQTTNSPTPSSAIPGTIDATTQGMGGFYTDPSGNGSYTPQASSQAIYDPAGGAGQFSASAQSSQNQQGNVNDQYQQWQNDYHNFVSQTV